MPIGTPMRIEIETAAVISARVWMLSSQRPSSANDTNAPNTISAARKPPKRRTMSVLAAIMPTQVSHSKAFSSAVTSHSANARNPSSTAKNGFEPSVRCSRSHSCASSSLRGSSSHVSDAGQENSFFHRT
jgi:hypothetical protein